jgi:hypothetical protein
MPAAAQLRKQVREEENREPIIRTQLPGPQMLFLRESEAQYFERLRQRSRQQGADFLLPEELPVSNVTISQQSYPRIDPATKAPFHPQVELVEPHYVYHRRLLFEQPNFERIGWDFKILQPAICLGVFYYDIAMLPYHIWTRPCDCVDCSAGKCLPGDPAPLTVTCEEFSVTGLLAEAGTIVGLTYFVCPFPWVR